MLSQAALFLNSPPQASLHGIMFPVNLLRQRHLLTCTAGPILLFLLTVTDAINVSAAPVPRLKVVHVDPLLNVFREDEISADPAAALMESARGEHATWQLVVRKLPVDLRDLRCEVTSFSLVSSEMTTEPSTTTTLSRPASASTATDWPARTRFVGYIGSSFSAKTPAKDQLRAAPAMYPDPLLEEPQLDVSAGDNQALWITARIPTDAQPGTYQANATITGKIFGYPTTATLPLTLAVYPATINKTRLHVTNWYQMWHHGETPMPPRFSDAYFDVLRTYIRNMVEHRQNWARIETLWIIGYGRNAEGKLTFDFTNFDRWMEILLEEGIENIEGLQYAWRSGKWEEPYHVEVHDENDTSEKGRKVPVDSPEAQEFYSAFFPALHAHLREKGWLNRYVQHVGDEPVVKNADSYTSAANLLRRYAPGIPIMEACLSRNMVGSIDIWVPILQELHKDFAFFEERKAAGDRVWFYTCLNPQGNYANRFVELPLIKTRLLHWINYRYDIEGFLHWGYNFWRPRPWDNATDVRGELPGGDAWIVYPEKNGLGIVESIRWEAMRDGIEDHELLSQLGKRNPEAAMDLARRHILSWNDYDTSTSSFRKTRRELLQQVSRLAKP